MNVIASGGGSNLYEPGEDANFTEEDIKERIFGSKIVVVSEQVRSSSAICCASTPGRIERLTKPVHVMRDLFAQSLRSSLL